MRWIDALGSRTITLFRDGSAFVDRHRERLPRFIRRRVKRVPASALLGAGLALAFLLFVLLVVGLRGLFRDAPEQARVEPAPGASGAPASVASAAPAPAPSAQPANDDGASSEGGALVAEAVAHSEARREAEAVAALEKALTLDSTLASDERVRRVLTGVLRSESSAGNDAAFTLLTTRMGAHGAEIAYDLAFTGEAPVAVRDRALAWVKTRDFDRVSSPATYAAARLRLAARCDQKLHLLKLAGNVGGRRALDYLRELAAHTKCEKESKGCYACLDTDGSLQATIARIEQRLGS